jgi:serine protease Do
VTIISRYDLKNNERVRELRELLQDPQLRDLFPRRRGGSQEPEEDIPGLNTNVGSGIVLDAKGIILTNNHVVADADTVTVRLPNGAEVAAKDIRPDPLSDLAVLRVETDVKLVPAKMGDSDRLDIGDWVIAIGSPFELEATVSAGIISGKGRGIEKIRRGRLLQTDAAINPGNSGGPLVDLDGNVVGINTAIATVNGGYQGIGFAIPANRATWVVRELLEQGRVRRAYLGIQISELTANVAQRLKQPARSGVWIWEVIAGSPAQEAGLRIDDIVVDFAGTAVRAPGDLQEAVERKPIGSKQKLTVLRQGKQLSLEVTMVALPDDLSKFAPAPKEEKKN